MKIMLRACCFLLVLFTTKGLSAATISINSATSTLEAGQSLILNIYVVTSRQTGGFSLYLDSNEPEGDIQITGLAFNTADFGYGAPFPSLPETISATQSSLDLGGFANSDLSANTQYLLTTVTVSLANNIAPGNYWIRNTS